MVVEAEIFPAVLTCLKDPDEYVKKNVATLIREIAKHTPEVHVLLTVVKCLMYSIYAVFKRKKKWQVVQVSYYELIIELTFE